MVTRFGMSTVGPISLDSDIEQVFIGRGIRNDNELSTTVANKIDDQVKIIVKHCYDQAVNIIKQNRFLIDQLVNTLIQEETINGEDFRQQVNMYTKLPEKFIRQSKKDTVNKEIKETFIVL